MKWSYVITSSGDNSNAYATQFGWSSRVPFLTRVLPAGEDNSDKTAKSLIKIEAANVLLINTKPTHDGKGIILHLRETEGQTAEFSIHSLVENTIFTTVSEANVLEEVQSTLVKNISLKPFETKFIKLSY